MKLEVRIPSWVNHGEAHCLINGKKKDCEMNGRYLNVGAVKPGDTITIEFPLLRKRVDVKAYDQPYSLDMKGFNIVEIWPKTQPTQPVNCPFYSDPRDRDDKIRMLTTKRFSPSQEMDW